MNEKGRYIGGVLEELEDLGGTIKNSTEITNIALIQNGEDSAFFRVEGKDFNCGLDVQYGGLTSGKKGWITVSGFGSHIWRFKEKGP